MLMGRSALFYEDYVLSIQRFNTVINAKPHLPEAYFYRGLAKFYLEDYTGAEVDGSSAIYRNPYVENYYVLRGLCRIHLNRFDEAEADYLKAIEMNETDANYWHNLVLCQFEQKAYHRADSCLDIMIRKWPKTAENYTLRAQLKMAETDTLMAEHWLDQALEVDSFDASALCMKAMLLLNRKAFVEGEKMLDRAIIQRPRQFDLYLNRALLRYNRNDLRGAMNDYDAAIDLNNNSFVGHFNRGLLRAQVGDDNRAIEDFNFVIEREPDNYIAIYNRAILLNNVGDYRGALRDLSTILKEYPQFYDGYLLRAQIRRKLGDTYGAERDEFVVLKARVEGVPRPKKTKKTRKAQDHDLEDYNMLVEEEPQMTQTEYASELRGRVQDKQTALQPMPIFLFSFFERDASINRYVPYIQLVEELNKRNTFMAKLRFTNTETAMPEASLPKVFDDINDLSVKIEANKGGAMAYLRRAVDYYHVRDFESAMTDVDKFLETEPRNIVGLMLRGQLRYSLMVANHSALSDGLDHARTLEMDEVIGLRKVLDDYHAALAVDAESPYAYYNIGNTHMLMRDFDLAIEAYSKALTLDPAMPDAYFNRGLAYLLIGQTEKGLVDLSQAGEFGLYSAYSLIKKYTAKK